MMPNIDNQKQQNISDKEVCVSELSDKAIEAAVRAYNEYHGSDIAGYDDMEYVITAYNQARWQPIESAPVDGTEFIVLKWAEVNSAFTKLYPSGYCPIVDVSKWDDEYEW